MTDSPRDHELERLRERYLEHREGRIFAPLADAYRKRGDLDEALRVCRKGLASHPDYSSAHVILAKIHLDRGETDNAEAAFDRVLELDPQNLLALAHLGRLADDAGRTEIAGEYWQRLLDLDPAHEEARARLEAEEEPPAPVVDAEEAAPEFPAGSEPEPETAEAEEAPAEETASEEAPDVDRAPEEAPAAARSPAAIATTTLADIYYEQGFKAKALAIYERILATGAPDPSVREKVDRIRAEMQEIESHLTGAETPELAPESGAGSGDTALSARFVDEKPSAGEVGKADPTDAPEADDVDEADFTHFRSWLDRVK